MGYITRYLNTASFFTVLSRILTIKLKYHKAVYFLLIYLLLIYLFIKKTNKQTHFN